MDLMAAGILCIVVLLVLMLLGVQIGLAFLLGGFVVSVIVLGFDSSVSLLGLAAYFTVATPTWAAIPLFILSYMKTHEIGWRTSIIAAGLTTVSIWALFEIVLYIELYRGLLLDAIGL